MASTVPNGSSSASPTVMRTMRTRDGTVSRSSAVTVRPRNSTSSVNATVKSRPARAPAIKASPSTRPSMRISTATAPSMATGPFAHPSIALSDNITATPSAPPIKVAVGDPWCMTCGRISVAAAAKTTPAARCCIALTTASLGRRVTATSDPTMTAVNGISVKITACMVIPQNRSDGLVGFECAANRRIGLALNGRVIDAETLF